MSDIYIALGSNMGDRLGYLKKGKDALARGLEITAISPVYETEAIGESAGGAFLNAVVAGRTQLTPEELLSFCLSIEQENGRIRMMEKGPRTLDLDLLLYGDSVFQTESLTLPHPGMHERAFVLVPLLDISPELIHPIARSSMRDLLQQLGDTTQLVRRTEYTL